AALQEQLKSFGRDPAKFGIEGWLRMQSADPQGWAAAADGWRRLGADMVMLYPMYRVSNFDDHIETLRRSKAGPSGERATAHAIASWPSCVRWETWTGVPGSQVGTPNLRLWSGFRAPVTSVVTTFNGSPYRCDPAANSFALAARPLQKHFACRQQLTAAR